MLKTLLPNSKANLVALVGLLLALTGGATQAETFVSYNGRFHFSYPDTWTQLDYTTAEYYLTQGDTTRHVDYEAVFCPKQTLALFRDSYLILTVDTVGRYDPRQVDSIMNGLAAEFKRPIKEVPSDAFITTPDQSAILFDRAGLRVAIESLVTGDSSGPRVNLLVLQFYERGIANYYFYSPAVKYAAALPDFRQIVTSFSIQPLPNPAVNEPVKIADIQKDSTKSHNYPLFFGPPMLVILIILAVRLRKRREQANRSDSQKG